MANLTAKELSLLSDQLSHEQVLIKKYRAMSSECQDPALKTKFEDIANRHQSHYDKLFSYLN